MSDTKWREVVATLAEFSHKDQTQDCDGAIRWVTLKFLDVEEAIPYETGHLHLWPPNVVDSPHGPFSFDELEWLEVPYRFDYKLERTIPARHIVHNIEPFASALDELGQLPVQLNAIGLRLLGYLTPSYVPPT